jgi:hypothetical protein
MATATATPKKERKKRERKDPVIPDPNTFTGPSKGQFQEVLNKSKQLMDAIKNATDVSVAHLREVKKATNLAMVANFKGRRVDPVERKKATLEKRIAKLKKDLAELATS